MTLKSGQTYNLAAIVLPQNASLQDINWISSNPTIASVDKYGCITANSSGECIIIASSSDVSNVSSLCSVIVKDSILISEIILNETDITISEGETTLLTYSLSPEKADNKTIQWQSDNDEVATVDQNGKITAVNNGSTAIMAKATDGSNVTAICHINVIDYADIEPIEYNPTKILIVNQSIVADNVPVGVVARFFQIDGTELYREISSGKQIKFNPDRKGIIIVSIGNNAYKIFVK